MDRLSEFTIALGQIAPFYNLGFVAILIFLYIKLFQTHAMRKSRVYLAPWVLLFAALCVFILEEVFTILRAVGVLNIPTHINGYFELVIIALFIYAVLLQKQFIKKHKL